MVQKKKQTRGRTGNRRLHHELEAKNLVKCPQCGQLTLPHTACHFCGTYRGRQVVSSSQSFQTSTGRSAKVAKKEAAKTK